MFIETTPSIMIDANSQTGKAFNLSNARDIAIRNAAACIFIGGKLESFQGIYPGIIEEVLLSIKYNKPFYLIGAFGGATKYIINCLLGNNPTDLLNDFFKRNPGYRESFETYNSFAKENGLTIIDFEHVVETFQSTGIAGIDNGLSEEENQILFETDNVSEIIALILKGIAKRPK